MNKQDAEMISIAKKALKSGFGATPKYARGLANNEQAMTIITFANGTEVKAFGETKALQVLSIARKHRQEAVSVRYVVTDRATKQELRIKASFRMEGINMVEA